MRNIIIILTCAAVLIAGLIGITLSVPLQAPAVILLGLAAVIAAAQVWKYGRLEVLASKKEGGGERTDDRRQAVDGKSKNWLLGLVYLSILYFILRAALSPVWGLGLEDLMLILSASILYLVASHCIRGKSAVYLRVGLAGVVITLLLMHIGSCVIQFNGGVGYSPALHYSGTIHGGELSHITGMYSYYGSFANFAIIAGMLCLSLGVWGRFSLILKPVLFILGLLALGLAVWSQSRSAVISMIPALALFIMLMVIALSGQSKRVKNRGKTVILILGILGLTLGGIGGIWAFSQRGSEGINSVLEADVRVAFWAMAAEQWSDYPWFGAGSRSFSYECFRYWNPNMATHEANPEFAHNEYLQLLADYGLIGLVLILALLGSFLFTGWRQVAELAIKVGSFGLKRGSNAMALAIAGTCGMLAMMVHVCFDFRTHLLSNLLLLVCCASWTMPIPRAMRDSGERVRRSMWLALVLFSLGIGAIGIGGQQLWAGWPLIENKVAKEHGTWEPQKVDRDVWIPMLEEALRRGPDWRRYQRLGTLYRIEADECQKAQARQEALKRAEGSYIQSIERHPANPVSRMNLAAIYTEQKMWRKADMMYASAAEMAKAREWWLRMHSHWADMHRQWAMDQWAHGQLMESETHFLKARELFHRSYEYGGFREWDRSWVVSYSKLLIAYARLLDQQQRYDEASLLFAEAKAQPNWYNRQVDTHLDYYYAQHLYEYGLWVWHERDPSKSLRMMKHAKSRLIVYRNILKNKSNKGTDTQYIEIQKVIDFLERARVK